MLMFDNVASETSPCTFHTASALSFISFLYFTNHEALSSHITLASYIYQAHINFFPDESVYPKKVAYQTKQTISFALHFLHPLSSISFLFIFHLSWGDSFYPSKHLETNYALDTSYILSSILFLHLYFTQLRVSFSPATADFNLIKHMFTPLFTS